MSWRNPEGYHDPTAGRAIAQVRYDMNRRRRSLNLKAKEYLSRAFRVEQMICSKQMQIARYHDLLQQTPTLVDSVPVVRTRNVHRGQDIILKIMEAEEELNAEIDKLVDLKREITRTISCVKDDRCRLVLEKRYLLYMKWEKIAEDMHYTVRHTQWLHDNALDEVGRILERGIPGDTGSNW